jgi:hypothetical protein
MLPAKTTADNINWFRESVFLNIAFTCRPIRFGVSGSRDRQVFQSPEPVYSV